MKLIENPTKDYVNNMLEKYGDNYTAYQVINDYARKNDFVLDENELFDCMICFETMGKYSQIGTFEELAPVYERIGTFMNEKCNGYTGGLITGNPDLARLVNLYYKTRVPFYNGPIDCRLFVYPGCELKGQNTP